ncbi:MAG TPA: hypothetical protein VF991_08320 [Reyranella sp.]
MEGIAGFVGAIGVGFIAGGVAAIVGRTKRRKRATAGDDDAKSKLEKWQTLETVVAPILVVVGLCMLAVKFYADYQAALTPLSPDKALERAVKSLPKSN